MNCPFCVVDSSLLVLVLSYSYRSTLNVSLNFLRCTYCSPRKFQLPMNQILRNVYIQDQSQLVNDQFNVIVERIENSIFLMSLFPFIISSAKEERREDGFIFDSFFFFLKAKRNIIE